MVVAVVSVVALLLLGLAVAYWAVVQGRLGSRAIRARLLWSFVLMAMLPAIAISAGTAIVGYSSGRRQAADRLQSVAARKESEAAAWGQSLQGELATMLNAEYAMGEIGTVLNLARDKEYLIFYNKALRDRLRRYAAQSRFDELAILDPAGYVVVSSNADLEGSSQANAACVMRGLVEPCAEASIGGDGSVQVHAVAPVIGLDGVNLGALSGRAGTQGLWDILEERTGLETSGKAYLVDPNADLLIDFGAPSTAVTPSSGSSHTVHSAGIDAVLGSRADGVALYNDYRGTPVVGVYRWLAELQIALLVEQNQTEAFQATTTTLAVNLGVALACILLAIVASLGITRSIARPLVQLAWTAEQIAAGDLDRSAPAAGADEVGALARAFNAMTTQLRDSIGRLEERVAERTHALERRALQMETSARVSREVTSILQIDELLTRLAELIRVTFDYYHVNVYLVEAEGKVLVRRACNGVASPGIERLAIEDRSLNSVAARTNTALLANDVAADSRFLADEYLPDTRSELVVPLRIADRVLGTLDVHGAKMGAFAPEDVLVIQSLADQVAIAIENAHLYVRSQELATLEERNRLSRELHDVVTQSLYSMALMTEAWEKVASAAGRTEEEAHLRELGEIAGRTLREARLLVHELRPSTLPQDGLLSALHRRLNTVERRAGVQARVISDELRPLPRALEEELFGIAIEALNNSLKHSGATSLMVRIRTAGRQVVLEVEDNGRGFDVAAEKESGGMGLVTMRERATRIGGSLAIESAPGQGTTVRVTTPGEGSDGTESG